MAFILGDGMAQGMGNEMYGALVGLRAGLNAEIERLENVHEQMLKQERKAYDEYARADIETAQRLAAAAITMQRLAYESRCALVEIVRQIDAIENAR